MVTSYLAGKTKRFSVGPRQAEVDSRKPACSQLPAPGRPLPCQPAVWQGLGGTRGGASLLRAVPPPCSLPPHRDI